jgi:hypothetical protein
MVTIGILFVFFSGVLREMLFKCCCIYPVLLNKTHAPIIYGLLNKKIIWNYCKRLKINYINVASCAEEI